MDNSSVRARRFRRLLLPFGISALMLAAACTPPPAPEPDPVTPWIEPGCLDSDMPGAPDFRFSGVANVVDNGISYVDEEGVPGEDGSCSGDVGDKGTIVRAKTEAEAIDVCASLGIVVADPPRLDEWGYPTPIDAWACVNETTAPDVVEFASPATVDVTIFGGTPEEPTETTVPFTGNAAGSWDRGSGAFSMNVTMDPGSFDANSPIGPVTVGYDAAQVGPATGSFDPATGEGGFTLAVDMTLTTLNGSPMPQPCVIGTQFDFQGAIDLATGTATVSQEDFTMTPPADTDCGGLGAIIGPMLAEGDNAATMTFQVFEP